MATRRGNQEGSFYKRANGTWCGQIMIDNKRYTVYAKGIQECRAKLRAKINEIQYDKTTITFEQFATKFTNSRYEQGLIKYSTYVMYRTIIKRLSPMIGNIQMQKITVEDLNKAFNALSEKYSAGTLKTQRAIVLAIFNAAYDEKICDKINQKNLFRAEQQQKMYTLPDVKVVLQKIREYPIQKFSVLFELILLTGLRNAETLALHWSDVNFETCTISITKNLMFVSGQGLTLTTPKSNRVGEFVQFPLSFKEKFLNYKKTCKSDIVFPNDVGKYMHLTATNIELKRVLGNLLPKGTGVHMLRHLHASVLVANGLDIKTIQKQLRHVDISTTDRYLHELTNNTRPAIYELEI